MDQSIFIGSTLFRRSFVGPEIIDPKAQGAVDVWIFYQCARSGRKACYIPQRLNNYRLHGDGMSQDRRWRCYVYEGLLYLYETMQADPRMKPVHSLLPEKRAATLTGYGISLLAQGNHEVAKQKLRAAWQVRQELRTLAALILVSLGPFGSRIAVGVQTMREHWQCPAHGRATRKGR